MSKDLCASLFVWTLGPEHRKKDIDMVGRFLDIFAMHSLFMVGGVEKLGWSNWLG